MANYYETLGVSENATEKEIRIARNKLIRQSHPDIVLNPLQAGILIHHLKQNQYQLQNPAQSILNNLDVQMKYIQK